MRTFISTAAVIGLLAFSAPSYADVCSTAPYNCTYVELWGGA